VSVWHRVVVTISIAGPLMLQWDTSVPGATLMGRIILALQWLVGAKQLWATKRIWLMGTYSHAVPMKHDHVSIGQGIWASLTVHYRTPAIWSAY